MKTNSVYLTKMQVGEVFNFIKLMLALFSPIPNLNARLKELVTGLSKTMADMEGVMSSPTYIIETKNKKAKDTKRDSEYLCFLTFTEAFTHSSNPAINEAANLIHKALKDAGNVQSMKLDKETSALYGLNNLFTTNERYIAALQTLNAKLMWDAVMAAQAEFEKEYSLVSDMKVKESEQVAAYELAKVARKQSAGILEMLDALSLVDPKPEYDELITKINHEIDLVMQQLRTRQTLAAKAKKEPKKLDSNE
ncbi:DUF6261 family protein [uncultured Acetobacteroides sp.]|uniref:DUF6261 family protein n=1 Tax=uncultured Acetobacteroides sp. TaxID=1760811 RepID=UPI0029F525E7|nr:DUF6261 family protein [uncultured Acetobacteroides sp.]